VSKKVRVFSPAKINLFLKVFRQRKDGFHDILSWMQMVDLRDEIEIEKIPRGIDIICDQKSVPTDGSNLAFWAAEFFLRKTKIAGGVRIKIKKRIPVGAGLGGGSSNAASVLIGLQKLFKTKLTLAELALLAKRLGSDVPFFFTSGSALAAGRGEKLHSLRLPLNYWLVLVNPGFEVSTKWAYSQVEPSPIKHRPALKAKQLTLAEMLIQQKKLGNDFQKIVCRRFPEVGLIIKKLEKSGALYAAMSGSGPTVFGIFESRSASGQAAGKMAPKKSWKTWLVKPIKVGPHGLP
jgi:4-diphosphocytidyl-2-C-methyl-D-erythritol kinase